MSNETAPEKITVCQGRPRCELEGDEAIAAQMAGCVWCRKIYVYDDGREEVEEPSKA